MLRSGGGGVGWLARGWGWGGMFRSSRLGVGCFGGFGVNGGIFGIKGGIFGVKSGEIFL